MVDYKELLRKYMVMICEMEGGYFIPEAPDGELTQEELDVLNAIVAEEYDK